MASALAVVLVMAAGELDDPSARAIGPALTTAARQDVALTVRESSRVPNEGDVARVAATSGATLVVEIAWESQARERAVVHLHDADGSLVASTVLAFRESESQAERGRAIGFAVGTMLPSPPSITSAMGFPGDPSPSPMKPEPEPPAQTAPPPVPPSRDTDQRHGVVSSAPPNAERRSFFAVGAAGVALTGIAGGASGVGGAAHVQLALSDAFALRTGATARAYSVDGSSADEVGPFAGVAWTMVHSGPFAVTTRVDALALRNAYSWTNPAGRAANRSTWIFGGAAALEAALRIARPLEAYLAPSIEIADRALADPKVGPSSPAWASLELGARFSF